ncbi:MAG: YcjF family protein, partial [Cyanobacteria bacterium P01_H01_bin.58]
AYKATLSATLITELETQRQKLLQELDRSQLKIAIAGLPRSGKTALQQQLSQAVSDHSTELMLTEISLPSDATHDAMMQTLKLQQDAVIYLVTEDLTESALTDLKTLTAAGHCVVLGLNKQDNYLPHERQSVLEQIQARVAGLPRSVPVMAIATAPKAIKVRAHLATGQTEERMEPQAVSIEPILKMVQGWLTAAPAELVLQTVMRQACQLQQDIRNALNQIRRQQAQPVLEQYQWTAAATAFASPVPSLDLIAAIAVNGQLVLDLGKVYQQPLSLDQATTLATELARILVKLGLVEVSSQLLTTALKSHAATYVVGGTVQAFSAAYLTQLCGESLMAYFEERALAGQLESPLSASAIGQKIKTLLPLTERTEFLQNLIKQGIQKLNLTPALALAGNTSMPVDLPALTPSQPTEAAMPPGEPV